MKISDVALGRWQRGWMCTVSVSVLTEYQSTAMTHYVQADGKTLLTALAKGLWMSFWYVRRVERLHASKRKEFGW